MVRIPEQLLHALENIQQKHTKALSPLELIESAIEWYLDKEASKELALALESAGFTHEPHEIHSSINKVARSFSKNSGVTPHPQLNPFNRAQVLPDDPHIAFLVERNGTIVKFKGACTLGTTPDDLIGQNFLALCESARDIRALHLERAFEKNTFEGYTFAVTVGRIAVNCYSSCFRVEKDLALVLQWFQPCLFNEQIQTFEEAPPDEDPAENSA